MGTRKLSEGGPVHTSQNRKGGQKLDIVKRIVVKLRHKDRRRSRMDIGPEMIVPVKMVSGREVAERYAKAMKEIKETAWIIDDSALKTPLKMVKLEKRYNEKTVFQSRLTAEDVRKQIQEDAKRGK